MNTIINKQTCTLLAGLLIAGAAALAEDSGSTLIGDPNFPLIRLPADYDSHRSTKRVDLDKGQSCEILNAKGPGCVRHFWITTTVPDDLEIEIVCDGAEAPQVRMTMHQFFGVLLGKEPYRIKSGPIKLLPKNGYNSYFPIPFQSSCRIVLRNKGTRKTAIWSMVNWQKYDKDATITLYRLHAEFSEEKPADPFGTTLLGSIGGQGFVAGMIHAIIRKDRRDVIWHTGGDTWLIDGETNPHAMRGIGSEDVFGHSFGVHKDMNPWMGAGHVIGSGPKTSEVVAYRFFGIDSVAFDSSLVLRFGTLANDIENILYYYKVRGSKPPAVESPARWKLAGPLEVSDFKAFKQADLPESVLEGAHAEWRWGRRTLSSVEMETERTWVDFCRWFRRKHRGNVGTQPANCAAYASTTIASRKERNVTLRFGCDDWMKIWLNGRPVTTLKHDHGFEMAEVPVKLKQGDNSLVVRLSNFDNVEWRCWAFSCTISNREQ